jgi:metal transporter CNNM
MFILSNFLLNILKILNIVIFLGLSEVGVFYFQVIPQSICTRYGLAVGANFVWLVRILMILCYPISYPIGKVSSTAEIDYTQSFL